MINRQMLDNKEFGFSIITSYVKTDNYNIGCINNSNREKLMKYISQNTYFNSSYKLKNANNGKSRF